MERAVELVCRWSFTSQVAYYQAGQNTCQYALVSKEHWPCYIASCTEQKFAVAENTFYCTYLLQLLPAECALASA